MSHTLTGNLCHYLLEGFEKGLSRSEANSSFSAATHEAVVKFMDELKNEKEVVPGIEKLIGEFPVLEPLVEYLFDLAILSQIIRGTEEEGDEYFDTPGWMALEEQTIDRGTELLNVLVYLRDCAMSEMKPRFSDFLSEFLLVEDDAFQDEFLIYEPFIRNQGMITDSSIDEMVEVGKKLEGEETQELFAPVFWFFANQELLHTSPLAELVQASPSPAVHGAIFNMLWHYEAADGPES